MTGRKIVVDTYGGPVPHGGGAFSGKDSAAYAARYVARNVVASGVADRCAVSLAYAIGVPEPTAVMINTFGTCKMKDIDIVKLVRRHFDMTPKSIIETLDLRRPIFKKTAAYGHFGRNEPGLYLGADRCGRGYCKVGWDLELRPVCFLLYS